MHTRKNKENRREKDREKSLAIVGLPNNPHGKSDADSIHVTCLEGHKKPPGIPSADRSHQRDIGAWRDNTIGATWPTTGSRGWAHAPAPAPTVYTLVVGGSIICIHRGSFLSFHPFTSKSPHLHASIIEHQVQRNPSPFLLSKKYAGSNLGNVDLALLLSSLWCFSYGDLNRSSSCLFSYQTEKEVMWVSMSSSFLFFSFF